MGVICSPLDQHACEKERHLGIVSRLAGDRVPGIAVSKVAYAVRIRVAVRDGGLEIGETTECLAGKLAEAATLSLFIMQVALL